MNWIKSFFFLHFLFVGWTVSAQNESYITGETYSRAANYVKCKYIVLALTQSDVKGVRDKFTQECPCIYNKVPSGSVDFALEKAYKSKDQIDYKKVVDLSNRIDPILELHEPTDILLVSEAINSLTNSGLITNKTTYLKPTDGLDENLQSLRISLTDIFSKELVQAPVEIITPDPDNEESSEEGADETSMEEDSPFPFEYLFPLLLFSISPIGIFVVYRTLNKKLTKETTKIEKKINAINSKVHTPKSGKEDNRTSTSSKQNAEVDLLKKQVNNHANELLKLKNEISQLGKPVERQISEAVQTRTKSTFYASSPVNERFLNQHATKEYVEGRSIYIFTKENSNKASFQVTDKTAAMRMALSTKSTNIEPVSQWLNVCSPDHEKITTLESGIVELRGEEWIVTKKAVVKYV